MKSIGETIANLRKQKGMTQSELAEKMNVTDKAVSKWERDLSCPDINTISKLADSYRNGNWSSCTKYIRQNRNEIIYNNARNRSSLHRIIFIR